MTQNSASTGRMVYLYAAPHAWRKANAAVLVSPTSSVQFMHIWGPRGRGTHGSFPCSQAWLVEQDIRNNCAVTLLAAGQCGCSISGVLRAMQVGIFQTLFLGATPEEAWQRLAPGAPYCPFRDASTGEAMMPLGVVDVIEVRAQNTKTHATSEILTALTPHAPQDGPFDFALPVCSGDAVPLLSSMQFGESVWEEREQQLDGAFVLLRNMVAQSCCSIRRLRASPAGHMVAKSGGS